MMQPREIEEVFFCILRNDSKSRDQGSKIECLKDRDWQRLYALAVESGLSPIFYQRLSALKFKNIPIQFVSRLKNLYLLNLKRNIILEQELTKLIALLEGNNISVIPLKGPTLARYLYGDLALRQTSCDLDLLVREDKIKDAGLLLKERGYSSYNEEKDSALRSIKLKYSQQLVFAKLDKGLGHLIVDLHCNTRGFFIETPLEDFWGNSRVVHLDGYKVNLPSNIDLLFYLSMASLSTFEFVELKYLHDIHTLVSGLKHKLDWPRIVERSKKNNQNCFVFFALELSRRFFHTELPGYLLKQLRPGFIKESIFRIWLRQKNILRKKHKIATSFTWRYFLSTYLSAKDLGSFFKKTSQKIFLPMDEVMNLYHQPRGNKSYFLYTKRLLKPILKMISKGPKAKVLQDARK